MLGSRHLLCIYFNVHFIILPLKQNPNCYNHGSRHLVLHVAVISILAVFGGASLSLDG